MAGPYLKVAYPTQTPESVHSDDVTSANSPGRKEREILILLNSYPGHSADSSLSLRTKLSCEESP